MLGLVGKTAPAFMGHAFKLEKGARTFPLINISDFKGKYLMLFFYPLNFTFVCPTQIISFSQKAKYLKTINTEVVGCSVDSKFSHMSYVQTPRQKGGLGSIDIPLLSDQTHQISKSYQVLDQNLGISYRGTFIIDPEQKVRVASINQPAIGRNVDEFVRTIEAIQYFDKHGEVCPANWKKGDPTIQPSWDSEKLKNYWQNVHAKK